MACISAETGTLVFAIVNIVFVTLSSVSSLGLLLFWSYVAFYGLHQDTGNGAEVVQSLLQLAAIVTMLTMSLISLMFASFLMNGIIKKKPEHIKVYYVFGVVKMVLTVLFVMGAFIASNLMFDVVSISIMLAAFSIYSLILYMIRRTYLQYETTNVQFAHKPLVEKC